MLQVARRTSPGMEWRQGGAEDLPLPDESFDAVVCSLSFQFFADKARALQEIRRVLAPGGRAALGTPGPPPPLMAAIDQVLTDHIGPQASMFVQKVFSVHDPDKVRAMFVAAGFDDVEVETRALRLRVPPPTDFFWQYVHSTPLAAIAAALTPDTRAALERDVAEQCQSLANGNGLVMETGLLVPPLAVAERKLTLIVNLDEQVRPFADEKGDADDNAEHNPARARLLEGVPLTERRLSVAGLSTAVLEGGDGPPLVLLCNPAPASRLSTGDGSCPTWSRPTAS